MKIAASDYDGTLFRNDTITAADAQSVQRWREAGHKFGVVTGRDYGMLAPQLEHYGIGYDYAVCNNGAIICQSDGTPLWEGRIEPRILKAISEIPEVRRSFHFAFSAATQTYLCHEFEGSWIAREGRQWDFPVIDIEEKDILSLPQIHQFSLGYETPEESLAASRVVNDLYGDHVHAYPNRCSLDITPHGISKSEGIEHLMELMKWNPATTEVYCIGDEINDLPMIKAYNGFTVDTARDEIKAQASQAYASVGAMLEANI